MLQWFFALPIHLRVAILVAPLLFILGWGGADYFYGSSQPTPPIRYASLNLNHDCTLSDQACEWQLSTTDLTVSLRQEATSQADVVKLVMNTEQSIKGIELRLLDATGQEHAVIMQRMSQNSNEWAGAFPRRLLTLQPMILRLALARTGEIFHFEGKIAF